MNYLVAVSGGVDSVVLLDMLSQTDNRIVIAHVDHGIRKDSAADARFVEALACLYKKPFVSTRLELGEGASEEVARDARYTWLFAQAAELRAEIVTAHHADDVVGSIAINCIRGTGWRGLAVMNRRGISRPLISWRKQRIYEYAREHKLEWVEDHTNQQDVYLRNRLRAKVLALPQKNYDEVLALRAKQLQLVRDIDREVLRCMQTFGDKRYPYISVDIVVGVEVLRQYIAHETGYRPSRLEAERMLHALKTGRPGTTHDLNRDIKITLKKATFAVHTSIKVIE